MNYNISELHYAAFGIRAQQYHVDLTNKSQSAAPFSKLEFTDYDGSLLGVPLFMPCTLDGVKLPNEPMIEISGAKNIVRTTIDGNDGTFKEMYSVDDYKITIRGICIQEDGSNNYPEEQVRQLHQLFMKRKELIIVNKLATLFNVKYIALLDLQLPAIEGLTGAQPYIFSALSDTPITLELDGNGNAAL
jgi:hypothetical protein